MSESRVERKERTRRAILDATLDLTRESGLIAVSLRQIAKQVGIVPTAFYRHFPSVEDLGLALVDESFTSLRALLREVRATPGSPDDLVTHSVDVLVTHVHRHRDHFGFIARERAAGPPGVRTAIRHQIELCERELAADLARLPALDRWLVDDLRILAGLLVTTMVAAAEALLATTRTDQERQLVASTRAQLRMIIVGVAQWAPSTD